MTAGKRNQFFYRFNMRCFTPIGQGDIRQNNLLLHSETLPFL